MDRRIEADGNQLGPEQSGLPSANVSVSQAISVSAWPSVNCS